MNKLHGLLIATGVCSAGAAQATSMITAQEIFTYHAAVEASKLAATAHVDMGRVGADVTFDFSATFSGAGFDAMITGPGGFDVAITGVLSGMFGETITVSYAGAGASGPDAITTLGFFEHAFDAGGYRNYLASDGGTYTETSTGLVSTWSSTAAGSFSDTVDAVEEEAGNVKQIINETRNERWVKVAQFVDPTGIVVRTVEVARLLEAGICLWIDGEIPLDPPVSISSTEFSSGAIRVTAEATGDCTGNGDCSTVGAIRITPVPLTGAAGFYVAAVAAAGVVAGRRRRSGGAD